MKNEELNKWEKEFDEEYGQDLDTMALGIIASTLTHAQTRPFGDDASYLTAKLRKIIRAQLTQSREEGKMDYARKLGQSLALKGISITELGNTDTVVDTILHAERTRLIELVEEMFPENDKEADWASYRWVKDTLIHKLKEQ
jgi:hypothetical protein